MPLIRTALATFALAAASVAPTGAIAQDDDNKAVDVNIVGAEATLINLAGENMGRANIRLTPSGKVLITVSASGLTPGWHALHVHETGTCDPATQFKSAGGHLADGKEHGVLVEGGPHPGDLPNQMVQESGQMVAEIFADDLTAELLFDADGSAMLIHSGRDDYQSQPAGDAGDRVACGVLEPAQ